jgi:uncharacterized protein
MGSILTKTIKYCKQNSIDELNFIFTGGEILSLGYDYLKSVFEITDNFAHKSRMTISKGIQTNLTLMDNKIANLLRRNDISLSTSYDVVGNNRKFRNGVSINKSLLDKLILVFKNQIPFCSIVVLTKDNYRNANEIYAFYESISTSFNVIPLKPQSEKHVKDKMVSLSEYIEFMKELATAHILNHKKKISVLCIDDYINLIEKGPGTAYQCFFAEDIVAKYNLFLEPNGDVYPCSSLQYPDLYLGNIFRNSLTQLFGSKVLKYLSLRQDIIKEKCKDCENYGLCFGGCMAFAYHEGNILAPSKNQCRINKAMFPFIRYLLSISN